MHMNIETYAHALTQVVETPEARMEHYLNPVFSFLIKIVLALRQICVFEWRVKGERWGQQVLLIVLLVPALMISNLERDSKIAKKEWPTLGKITTFSIQSNLLPE